MDLENNLVGWDSQDDPSYPRNFAENRKWFIMALLSAITFLCPLTSSIFAPAVDFMNADFHNTSLLLGTFAVSVFVLGFSVSLSPKPAAMLETHMSAGRSFDPGPLVRDLRSSHSPQWGERDVLCIRPRVCVSTQSQRTHRNAVSWWRRWISLSDGWIRCHRGSFPC